MLHASIQIHCFQVAEKIRVAKRRAAERAKIVAVKQHDVERRIELP
jgi:hypothetical protein